MLLRAGRPGIKRAGMILESLGASRVRGSWSGESYARWIFKAGLEQGPRKLL